MASSKLYYNGWSTSSKLCRGSTALGKMAKFLPGIIVIVLLIAIGKIWSTYSSDIQGIKLDWNILQTKTQAVTYTMDKLAWLVLPLLTGTATTVFSWAVLYLDSNKPGVDPPLPFSPLHVRQRSGHTFHLQYTFTLYLGVLVSAIMIYDGLQAVSVLE